MLPWIIALVAAAAVAAWTYFRERRNPLTMVAAALRALAVMLAVALALDAPRGRGTLARPMVAVDASSSWRRGRPDTTWRRVLDRARAAAGSDTVWLAGDSLRPARDDAFPADNASRIEPAVDRALGAGRPLMLFSDGEIDDPHALERLLAGSRIEIAPPPPAPDAAIVALELPRSVVAGDTTEVVVRLAAGAAGAGAGTVAVSLDRTLLVRLPVEPLDAFAERDVRARVRMTEDGGEHRVVRAVLSISADAVAANDSLAASIDVVATPRGVFVSTAPDQDARFALEVLRGTLSIAVRAFYRVAPGAWRQEPGFTPVTEAAVRTALAEAPLAILHGDTALFGAPRALTTGALAMLAPAAAAEGDEWYATSAPLSPVSGALTGLPWDSLPPVTIGAPPRGEWTAVVANRPRMQRDERALVAGTEHPRRIVVVAGSGYWRWRFRAGASADAYAALFGGLFDWLAEGGDDRRAAVPAAAWTRAGEPVAWRRGARRDSVVTVVLRSNAPVRVDTVTLRFRGDAIVAESPPLAAGEYAVSMNGGDARLVVAASREWLPRRASVPGGEIGTARAAGLAPRLRDAWWAYVMLVVALCGEWVMRRRVGLR